MANPSSVHVSVTVPCIGEQVVNLTEESLYAGGSGDFQYIFLYKVEISGVDTWELRTIGGPGVCAAPVVFRRSPAEDNPVGTYNEVNASGTAVVTEF